MPTTYAIPNGRTAMDVTLYTGAGGNSTYTNNDIGTNGFLPDLTWIKGRSNTGSHVLQDTNRGAGSATKLSSNSNNAENNNAADATDPIYGYISAFNSNGFSVVDGTSPAQTNKSGVTYVAWQWNAGSNVTVSNTSGNITSTVSANTTAGFSIVKYSGNGANNSTVGHGLGATPSMIIIKGRNSNTGSSQWLVEHSAISGSIQANTTTFTTTNANIVLLNANNASLTYGIDAQMNGAGGTYVAYCWTPIPGFSQFGSYIGNGSTNGPFVYTGFRPRFVMIKRTDTAANWLTTDSAINPYNVTSAYNYPNLFNAEATGTIIMDLISNGFKLRADGASYPGYNASGGTYIYAAFAENPFKYANAR